MAQVAVKEIDLSAMLNQLNTLSQKFNTIEKIFSKLDLGFEKITQSSQKFNRNMVNAQKQSVKLYSTFSKIQDTLRFIAMTPFGKGLALGVGAISSAWDFAKNASAGTQSDLALARGSGSTLKNLRAFDRAGELGGVGDLLNSQMIRTFKQNLNDVNMQGQRALLGSLLGKDRDALNKMDTTDLYVQSLGAIDKLVKELGGYDNLASNQRGKQILEIMGLNIGDLRSIKTGQFASDYQSNKMQGINEKEFSRNERAMLNLGYGFKDLKDTLIMALMPTFTEFAKKIHEVARSLTKWLLDNRAIERIGKGLGNIANKILNIKFDDIIDLFTNKLPQAFFNIFGTLLTALGTLTPGKAGDTMKVQGAIFNMRATGMAKEMIDSLIAEAERRGLSDNGYIGENKVNFYNKKAEQYTKQQKIEVTIKTAPSLQADVTKATAGANLTRIQK